MNSFDKNATIQFSLNETNANINEKINLKKVYSKKNLRNYKDIKYKTNYHFFQKNKNNINNLIPKNEGENEIYSNKIIPNNIYSNNTYKHNKAYNNNIPCPNRPTKIIPNNNNIMEIEIKHDKKASIPHSHSQSFQFIQDNKNNFENKKIKFKRNSSFDNGLNYQNNNTLNEINKIYIKKKLNSNSTEHYHQNSNIIYRNKYNYNQNNYFKKIPTNIPNIKQNENNIIIKNDKDQNINIKFNFNKKMNNKISKSQNIILLIIEQLLVLEDKLKEIIISLNTEKSISYYCFEFWNYFYNSLIFSKFEIGFKEVKDINIIKISFNLILFTIMICYDFSFETNKLINIYLFLSEILELNHKILLLVLDQISNKIKFNNRENNWILRAVNTINNFNLTEDNDNYTNNIKYSEVILFKLKININLITQKINNILLTNKTNFNECLIRLFNKIKNESFIYLDDFFKEYLLRENFIECSVTALTYLKEEAIFEPVPAPYIKNKNKKKFSLILDLDETLIHFQLNKENFDEGVLKLRPNLYKFLDNLTKYYEIILFTEGSESYSELLIKAIEENKKYFEYKLFRQHTVIIGNDFIKDLTRIGRPLNSIIIIDNYPQNFRLQEANGINIKSFFGDDDEDNTLIDLMNILIKIAKEEKDVRKGIMKYHEEIIAKITSNIYKHNKY